MAGAPWTALLIELGRLAPAAITSVTIDPGGEGLRLSLRQAVSTSPAVSLAADIAMSSAEAERVAARLALGEPLLFGPRADDAGTWLEAPGGPCEMVSVVALIRALMRPELPAHA